MQIDTEVHVTSFAGGVVQWSETMRATRPPIVPGNVVNAETVAQLQSTKASACIYCGSTTELSKEQVMPLALNGTTIVRDGSCEVCRRKTQRFEDQVLRGEMWNVRVVQKLASRTRHKEADKTVEIIKVVDGSDQPISIALEEAPVLLSFPLFAAPTIKDDQTTGLEIRGLATVAFGADLHDFSRSQGVEQIKVHSRTSSMVAFAQSKFVGGEASPGFSDKSASLSTALPLACS